MYCIKATLFHLRKVHTIKTVKHILHIRHRSIPFLSRLAHSEPIEDDADIIVKSICQGDQELERKLRIIMLEVEVMRQDGRQAPECLRQDQWERLLKLSSKNQRSSYLSFLFKTEKAKENEKAKKEARKIEREAALEEQDVKEFPDDLLYGIKYQTLFLRIRDQSINNFDNYRTLKSILYGHPVVVDCSYEKNMVWRETKNAAKQMTMVLGNNRLHKEPFDIHMCNVQMKGDFMAELRKNVPILEDPCFPINIHTKSYLDIFPKEKLVYLTPHCREELTTFDHDAVYIIGCMVDTMNNEPLSLAKAKRDGLRMAKLPLERYIEWAPGAKKNLNINHMVPILLDLRLTGDWDYAFRHIPRRKLMETKILAMQREIKNNNFLKDEIFKSYRSVKGSKTLSMKMKTKRSGRSLYDDDEKI